MKNSIPKPTKNDQLLAERFLEVLKKERSALRFNKPNLVKIRIEDNPAFVVVPMRVFELWVDIMEAISKGTGISIVKSGTYLSTQDAADLLGVSRPNIVKLIENGDIPCKKVGSHRRILIMDLEHYQIRMKELATGKLAFIANPAQQINLEL